LGSEGVDDCGWGVIFNGAGVKDVFFYYIHPLTIFLSLL
jgi:hypothetical protein